MLLFSGINDNDLDQIYEIRGADNVLREKDVSAEDNIDFGFPHDAYHIGLSSLTETTDPDIVYSGVRIVEILNNNFNFIYDIHKSFDGYGPQMFKDKKFIAAYESAFETLASQVDEENNYAVRILGVPSLYIEALWLHDEANEALDQFLMVRSVSLLGESKFYNRKDFFDHLRKRARDMSENNNEQKNENDDEVSGLEPQPA